MKFRQIGIIYALDLAGTFLFAVEGAIAAANAGLDVFGIMVLSFSTALIGGVVRDLLIGAVPPQAIKDWRYSAIAFAGGAATFFFHRYVLKIPAPVFIGLDAAALSLFAIAGAEKALDFGIHPLVACLMGTLTGVGGGTLRDILLARIPIILRADVYATAAFAGAAAMIIARRAGVPPVAAAALGGAVCFGLRIVAVWQHWSLPRLPGQ